MNFARDVLDRLPAGELALIELARDGARREWTFGEIGEKSARLAGTLKARGVGRGDVVMTLIGNRPEWVAAMCACFRLGAVALPCTEQLRAKDLRLRLDVARPSLVIADERNRTELEAAEPQCEVALVPDEALFAAEPAPASELDDDDPCLITFTSGTSGEPKAVVHGQRYLYGQRLQATHWLGARAGELVWCTAASGWSKSARNVFIAPWLSGAAALLHDARFDPHERLELLRSRAGRRAVHGAHGVPRDRQARDAHRASGPARHGGRRRGPEPRGAARLQGGHGARDPRRLRSDRDRTADRDAARPSRHDPARWGWRCREWT